MHLIRLRNNKKQKVSFKKTYWKYKPGDKYFFKNDEVTKTIQVYIESLAFDENDFVQAMKIQFSNKVLKVYSKNKGLLFDFTLKQARKFVKNFDENLYYELIIDGEKITDISEIEEYL